MSLEGTVLLPARATVWNDAPIPPGAIAAAKLHLLHLEPIRQKLGPRWPRLSHLVHAVFEKALRRAQGPADNFVAMGELSYVVTFHGLSPEEAGLACAAIASEVCEHLFGDGLHGIAVRSLVGAVPPGTILLPLGAQGVEKHLERHGTETLVRLADKPAPVPLADDAMAEAHERMRGLNRGLALFPLWDLGGCKSSALLLSPHAAGKGPMSLRRLIGGGGDAQVTAHEILLLKAAGEYAMRVKRQHRVCAIGVGVSYETLTAFHSRIRYIGALRAQLAEVAGPFLLKIEQVPDGTPLGRLGEMIAMLSQPNLRILVEFANGAAIPDIDLRLGAAGIGALLPDHCSAEIAEAVALRLVKRAAQQKAFAFVGGLAHGGLLRAVRHTALRFGMGAALDGGQYLTGLENLPEFPLSPAEHPVPPDETGPA